MSLMTGVAFCSITSDARYDCEGRDRSLGNRRSQKYCFLYCNHEKASAKSTVVFFFLCFLFVCFERQRFTVYSVFSFLIRQNSGELVVNVIKISSFFPQRPSCDRRSRQWNITKYLINLKKISKSVLFMNHLCVYLWG